MRVREFLDFQIPSRKSAVILISLSSIVFSLSFLIYVRVQQSLVGYLVAEREVEMLDLEDRLRQLKLEKAVLMRPERIQKRAHERFNMRYSHD